MLPQKLKYDLYYIYYTKASPQNIATMIVLYIEAEDKHYFKKERKKCSYFVTFTKILKNRCPDSGWKVLLR